MLLKSELIKKYEKSSNDTGSTAIQIIRLAEENQNLISNHLSKNRKDIPAKRAMLKKTAKKKRYFAYLARKNPILAEKLKKDLEK